VGPEIIVLLRELGLGETEISLYLALVGKRRLTAYELAKQAKIHRSTAYDALARLVKQGFVGTVREGEVTRYVASPPTGLLADLKSKEAILQRINEEIKNLNSAATTTVSYTEGVQSQKQFNVDAFNTIRQGKSRDVLVLGNGPSWTRGSELLIDTIISALNASRPRCAYRAIWDLKYKKKPLARRFEPLGKQRYLRLPSLTTTVIYADVVALLFSTDTPKVVRIQEKQVATEMRAYFEHLWRIAKP
jgi:predicted transcriptional regulator